MRSFHVAALQHNSTQIRCFDLCLKLASTPYVLILYSFSTKHHSPKIRSQVHNLPSPQSDQHAHCAKRKPLDALVRALIRISELLFADAQVLHFLHDLVDRLLDPSQLRLDGLQFLGRLDGGPVAGVGANVDVQLDVAGGRRI